MAVGYVLDLCRDTLALSDGRSVQLTHPTPNLSPVSLPVYSADTSKLGLTVEKTVCEPTSHTVEALPVGSNCHTQRSPDCVITTPFPVGPLTPTGSCSEDEMCNDKRGTRISALRDIWSKKL